MALRRMLAAWTSAVVVLSLAGVPAAAAPAGASAPSSVGARTAGLADRAPGLVPVNPTRVLDTRDGTGAPKGTVRAGGTVDVLTSGADVPSGGAKAVVVNVTVTAPSAPGYVTSYPSASTRPTTSMLNYRKGQTVANQAVVQVGADNRITLYTSASAHLVVDLTGYYPSASAYVPVSPARILDTRDGTGAPKSVVRSGGVVALKVSGRGGVPAGSARSVVLNVTATSAAGPGYVTAYPEDVARPGTSSLTYSRGSTVAGLVVTGVGSDGVVDLFTSTTAHLVVDVVGYLPRATADFVPLVPTRVFDTRQPRTVAGGTATIDLAGDFGIPTTTSSRRPVAVELTVTTVAPERPGFIAAATTGSEEKTSIVNYVAGQTTSNSTTLALATTGPDAGSVQLYSSAGTHLVVDVTGYFVDADSPTVDQVATGRSHSCALLSSGDVTCWGANDVGQLGNGTTTPSRLPVQVEGLTSGVVAISAGGYYTCALLATGGVRCWGNNDEGPLGNGTTTRSTVPVDVTGLASGVTSISAGYSHACAVLDDGSAECWGSNANRELGADPPSRYKSTTPLRVEGLPGAVRLISAGRNHTCGVLVDRTAVCWGTADDGQLGNGEVTSVGVEGDRPPVRVRGLTSGVVSLSAGSNHTCASLDSGAALCWGGNSYGQLGDGVVGDGSDASDQPSPRPVTGLASGVASIAAGEDHSCAVLDTGAVRCWGADEGGQLGDGAIRFSVKREPSPVATRTYAVTSLSVGGANTCSVTDFGAAACWGDDTDGQLGRGRFGSSFGASTPAPVVGP